MSRKRNLVASVLLGLALSMFAGCSWETGAKDGVIDGVSAALSALIQAPIKAFIEANL